MGLADRPKRLLPIPDAYVGARRRRGFDIDENDVPRSGVPISHETVRQVLARPEGTA